MLLDENEVQFEKSALELVVGRILDFLGFEEDNFCYNYIQETLVMARLNNTKNFCLDSCYDAILCVKSTNYKAVEHNFRKTLCRIYVQNKVKWERLGLAFDNKDYTIINFFETLCVITRRIPEVSIIFE